MKAYFYAFITETEKEETFDEKFVVRGEIAHEGKNPDDVISDAISSLKEKNPDIDKPTFGGGVIITKETGSLRAKDDNETIIYRVCKIDEGPLPKWFMWRNGKIRRVRK